MSISPHLHNHVVRSRHILSAQKRLRDHWGASYFWLQGKPLTRDYPSSKRNRRIACRDLVKTAKNNSCDEYPFNSTNQGAGYVGRHRISVKAIPGKDNSTAGSFLAQFYVRNRILNDDTFWVQVR
jgi:hypothetical protein